MGEHMTPRGCRNCNTTMFGPADIARGYHDPYCLDIDPFAEPVVRESDDEERANT